jgi:hypothetical protein
MILSRSRSSIHAMADVPALVSPHSSTRESRRRNWAVAGAALFSLFVVAAYIQPSTLPVALRSKTIIPDAGLDGPLNPTSAAMRVIAPDMYFATVATTEGHFTIQVTRSWAPHAADRFYNLAKNGQSARFLMPLRCIPPPPPRRARVLTQD